MGAYSHPGFEKRTAVLTAVLVVYFLLFLGDRKKRCGVEKRSPKLYGRYSEWRRWFAPDVFYMPNLVVPGNEYICHVLRINLSVTV